MSFPQGIAFRSSSGFVTDGANDFGEVNVAYPHTSTQGNNVGYEAGPGSMRDRNAGNDPRIAGCHFESSLCTYRIDLPATGSYKARIAIGDAASYGQAAKCEIFDTTTSLGVLSSTNTTGSQHFRDATDAEYTNVTWPGSNALTASLTFASTICRFKFGVGGVSTAWAYVYVESAGGGGTSVALTGVTGTGSVGSVSPAFSIPLTGVSGTGSVGTVSPNAAVTVALTGVSGTGSVGSVAPAFSIPLTGVTGTGSVGTVIPTSGTIVALTGVSATGSVGSVAPAFSIALTGVSAVGSVGSVSLPSLQTSLGGVHALQTRKGESNEDRRKRLGQGEFAAITAEALKTLFPHEHAAAETIAEDRKAAKLRAARDRILEDSARLRARIEAANDKEVLTAAAARNLTRMRQALQMKAAEEAFVLEQLEVMDIAFVAMTVIRYACGISGTT